MSLKTNYNIVCKLWRWPGDSGWHFVTLDKDLSSKIRSVYTKGFVKITAQIGKTKWDTSLFPHKKSGYLICINKQIRNKEDVLVGDVVKIKFTIK